MGRLGTVNVVIGIPSFGMVSTYFMQARASQQFPLVSSSIDKIVLNKPIADARNEIVEFALSQGANYIYWLDDDVIAPPDSFLKLFRHGKDIINGVYWSKSSPPMPLLFRDHLKGPYYDWKVGDLIEIDAAGSGLTLVKTDVYRKIQKEVGEPWYSVDYTSFPKATVSGPNNTEDLYFYWKAKKAGYKVWADTSVQALHYDKKSGISFGMPSNSPQAFPAWKNEPKGNLLIADIGAGEMSPDLPEGQVVTFDIREETKPDVVCDVRFLPVEDQTFDMVFSSHVLEHFSWTVSDKVLREWSRVLKVGGELRLVLPNIRYVAKRLLEDQIHPYDYWVLYGEQTYPKNFHETGFTPNTIRALIESLGIYDNIQVKEGNIDGPPVAESWSMMIKATKVKHPTVDNITPEDIEAGPESINYMPVAIESVPVVKPITEEEIKKDVKFEKASAEGLAKKEKFLKSQKEK